jgi:acyl-CoA synthetase (AMP-forming)/AMP-acid ligase II
MSENLGNFLLGRHAEHPSAVALWDPALGEQFSHALLFEKVQRWAAFFAAEPRVLAVVRMSNDISVVAAWLGLLTADIPIMVLDAAVTADYSMRMAQEFDAGWIVAPTGADWMNDHTDAYRAISPPELGVEIWYRRKPAAAAIDADLALLLPTSGSTGSPRMVRLSKGGLTANIEDIITVLQITSYERAVTSLPLSYCYGLSVLTTHLRAGAAIVLTGKSIADPAFWDMARATEVTTFAGVPYMYRTLRALGTDAPTISVYTQAGGALEPDCIRHFGHRVRTRHGRFYVMYGQTEAGPRIATLAPEDLERKLGSVGTAMPSGQIWLEPTTRNEDGVGEIVYAGPNVMMGYAASARDLARGDDMQGTLHTGDLGYVDTEGYLYLTGRVKRIAKILGRRINLDDVERRVGLGSGNVAAIENNETIILIVRDADEHWAAELRSRLMQELRIPRTALLVRGVDTIPTLPNSKIDYAALGRDLAIGSANK